MRRKSTPAEVKASSKSKRASIRDVKTLRAGSIPEPTGELSKEMLDELRKLVEYKYREACELGFRAGHMACRRHCKKVPKKLESVVYPTLLGPEPLFGSEFEIEIQLASELE